MHKIIKELESDNSRLAKKAILYRELDCIPEMTPMADEAEKSD